MLARSQEEPTYLNELTCRAKRSSRIIVDELWTWFGVPPSGGEGEWHSSEPPEGGTPNSQTEVCATKLHALSVPDVCGLRDPAIPVRAGSGESFAPQLETH